jgi:hypothetical protein
MKSFITSIAVSSILLGSAISLFAPLTSSSEDAKSETPPTADMAQATAPSKDDASANNKDAPKKEGDATAEAAPAAALKPITDVTSCLSDPIVLDEIKKKHEEIDKKWKDLEAHEAELKARESAVNDELKKKSRKLKPIIFKPTKKKSQKSLRLWKT